MSILFAPRTVADARTARSRHLAVLLGSLRRRAVSKVVATCVAVARAVRHQEELADMLRFDDRLLRDIGVTRGDILAAVQEQRWTRAAWRLITAALTRRGDGAPGKSGAGVPVSFRARPVSRARKRQIRGGARRRAA
jgi:uncharacterized protein YjiS (DUF1127 family)